MASINKQSANRRLLRLTLGVAVGIGIFIGLILLLTQTLGSRHTLYQGKSAYAWAEQLNGSNAAISREAKSILLSQIIPHLTQVILTDTNKTMWHESLVHALNTLPGIEINFVNADGRRAQAVCQLSEFGSAAEPAFPLLFQLAQTTNSDLRGNTITALGQIHCQPDKVIPFLISLLDDEDLNDEAAEALGNYGPLAKPAVPKIIPLLKAKDKDTVKAAIEALQKIDPVTLSNVWDLAHCTPRK